jgi:hypothetical protein
MQLRKMVCLAVAVSLFGATTLEAGVVAKEKIPRSEEPASVDNPPCVGDGYKTAAQQTWRALETATDIYLGGPYTTSVSAAFPEKNAWKAARLGIHDGKSRCRLLCAIVPRDTPVKACLSDGDKSCTTRNRPGDGWGIGWIAVVNYHRKARGDYNDIVCATGKNWSHNRDRTFTLEVE